jgi:aminopeptidase YwaD
MTVMIELNDWTALATRLRGHVEALAAAPRAPGSASHRQAADYISHHLQAAGLTVERPHSQVGGLTIRNLLTAAVPDQPSRPLIIVGAHYDSGPHTPGADDNASGVAALLELASWLHPRRADAENWSGRVQLVAYDLEEYGMVGSSLHSQEMQQAGVTVRGMISLEMLAYTDLRPGSQRLPPPLAPLYPTVGNFIGICGNEASHALCRVVTEAMKTVPDLPVESLVVPGRGQGLPEVRLSDHSSFWDRDYPALMITDTSFFRNPHYHLPSDTPQTLDYGFLARVTAGVCASLHQLLLG